MSEAFICDAVRTPIGRYGGALAAVRTDDLGARSRSRALRRAQSRASTGAAIDDVIYGCANQAGEDNRNVARMALLLAGLPVEVPGTTVNRLCGSGMDAVGHRGARDQGGRGRADDRGRRREHVARAVRDGQGRARRSAASAEIYDTTIGWRFVNPLMKAAVRRRLDAGDRRERRRASTRSSREDQDAFALRSQQRAAAAQENGRLAEEIVAGRRSRAASGEPLRRRARTSTRAPTPRSRRWRKLPTPFRDGRHGDGRQRLGRQRRRLRADRRLGGGRQARTGSTPRARVVAAATAGVRAAHHGHGPGRRPRASCWRRPASSSTQIDVIELNEAFAAQALAVLRELGLPRRRPARQPERRRDRARPSARHERRAARHDRQLRAARTPADATRCARCASASARASRWCSSASDRQRAARSRRLPRPDPASGSADVVRLLERAAPRAPLAGACRHQPRRPEIRAGQPYPRRSAPRAAALQIPPVRHVVRAARRHGPDREMGRRDSRRGLPQGNHRALQAGRRHRPAAGEPNERVLDGQPRKFEILRAAALRRRQSRQHAGDLPALFREPPIDPVLGPQEERTFTPPKTIKND